MLHFNLPDGAWAVIYCRVSDPSQSGIPAQHAWAVRTAAKLRLTVAADLQDEGVEGDNLDRDGLVALEDAFRRAHATGKPIICLLIDQADRLSRADSIDTSEMLARLRRHGLRYIITGARTYDLRNAMDRTMFQIEADHKNNPWLKDQARRALAGVIDAARAGFWSGRVPTGYLLVRKPGEHGDGKKRTSGRLEECPVAGAVMRELPQRYLAGQSTCVLAAWLDQVLPKKNGRKWTHEDVRKMLRNRIYTGVRLIGKQPQGRHVGIVEGQAVILDEDQDGDPVALAVIRIPNAAPALWSDPLFDAVQARLDTSRRRGHKREFPPLPLANLGTCGHCGAPAYCWRGQDRKGRPRALIACGQRRNHGLAACPRGAANSSLAAVMGKILGVLADNLLAEDAVNRLVALATESSGQAQAQAASRRDALDRQLAENTRETERARRRWATAAEDLVGDAEAALRTLKDERANLEDALRALDREQQAAAGNKADPDRLRAWLEACRKLCRPGAAKVEYRPDEDDGTLNALLGELIAGFVVFWRPNRQGTRPTLDRVEVELPVWLTNLLATGARARG
jgi:DNA invertase Pin-like site-specific DNA recombinase